MRKKKRKKNDKFDGATRQFNVGEYSFGATESNNLLIGLGKNNETSHFLYRKKMLVRRLSTSKARRRRFYFNAHRASECSSDTRVLLLDLLLINDNY